MDNQQRVSYLQHPELIEDKVIIFGGWKPYMNLKQIEMLDLKTQSVIDINEYSEKMQNISAALNETKAVSIEDFPEP